MPGAASPQTDADRADGPRGPIKQYSRFVATAKVVLPTVALILLVVLAIWPHIRPRDSRFALGVSAIDSTEVQDPAMVNARYTGQDAEERAFSITADLAKNLTEKATEVELEMPKADITLDDGTWLVLTANTGTYSQVNQTLDLEGQVNLFHDSGYEIRTEKVTMDLRLGSATSSTKVRGQGPFGDLEAEGFRLIDQGATIHFTGKTHIVMYRGVKKDTQ